MALENTDRLQAAVENSIESFLRKKDRELDSHFEVQSADAAVLLVQLYNTLAQAILEWGQEENHPVNGFSFLDKHQIVEAGGRLLPQEKWIERRIASFLGFKSGKAYGPNLLSIGTYRPEGDRARLEISGATIDLTRSQVIHGKPPLVGTSNYNLAVKPPHSTRQGVWSLKLMEKPMSESERRSAEGRRATASRRQSIDLAKALESEGLRYPYLGGSIEMSKRT